MTLLNITVFPAKDLQHGNLNLLTSHQQNVLSIIYLLCSILSLFGSISIILKAIQANKMWNPAIFPIFNLSIADCFGSWFLLLGTILHLAKYNYESSLCFVITMTTTFFYMVTFLLTTGYALSVFREVRSKQKKASYQSSFSKPQKNYKFMNWKLPCYTGVFYCFAWIFPFVVTIVAMFSRSQHTNGNFSFNPQICSFCYPLYVYENKKCLTGKTENMEFNWYQFYKQTFLLLLLLSIVSTLIIYFIVSFQFKKLAESGGVVSYHQYNSRKKNNRQSSLFVAAFTFCWVFTIILGFLSLATKFDMKTFFPLFIIQAITSPLQGFLNSIIYGWRRSKFRHIISENTALILNDSK